MELRCLVVLYASVCKTGEESGKRARKKEDTLQ